MPKLKVLSGKDVIGIFQFFDFVVVSQRGSHVKLRRIQEGIRQVLTIPLHREMDKGTTKTIYMQALHYISSDDLYRFFYTE